LKPTVGRTLRTEARSLKRLRQEATLEVERSAIAQWLRPAILFSSIGFLFLGFNLCWWVMRGEPVLLNHIGFALAWGVILDINGLLLLCGTFYVAIAVTAIRRWLRERHLRRLAVDEAQRLVTPPRN
jgi:hypothetical protein